MKKQILIVLCALLLTGCASSGAPAATEQTGHVEASVQTQPATVTLAVYASNDQADGLVRSEVQVGQIHETVIVDQLILKEVLPLDAAVNSLKQNEKQLAIDFNTAFQTRLCSLGTAGENPPVSD